VKAFLAGSFMVGAFWVAIFVIPVGCGEDPQQDGTGVLIDFLVANTTSSTDLATQIDTLEILLDSADGFNGVGEGAIDGFEAADYDADGTLELLLSIDLVNQNELPVIRLDPGSNLEKQIAIKVRGLNQSLAVVALGGKPAEQIFPSSGLETIWVPLELTRDFRAPSIVNVSPSSNSGGIGGISYESIAFYSSKSLAPESLTGNVHLSIGDDSDITGQLEGPRSCPFGAEMWVFTPQGCHRSFMDGLSVRLVLDAGITDLAGNGLQDSNGTPGFSKTIQLTGFVEMGDCTELWLDCARMEVVSVDMYCDLISGQMRPADCTVPLGGCEQAGDSFDWVQAGSNAECRAFRGDTVLQDGFCVVDSIDFGSCTNNSCSDSQVCMQSRCHPRIGGCVDDCQQTGACPEYIQSCQLNDSNFYVCR
jgi:hypothetical protein